MSHRLSEEHELEEQQTLLHPDPAPTMGSDATKPEGRESDGSASVLVWVCAALRPPLSYSFVFGHRSRIL